jgi:hypothetical protein
MDHHGRRGSTRRDNWARLAARLACLYRCSKLALRAGSDQERSHSPSLVLADASAQVAAVTVGYQLLGDHLQGRADLGI